MAATPSNSMNLNSTTSGLVNWDGVSVMSSTALTEYSVLSGDSSNTINNIVPNTAGYVLTSNGAAAQPTFQASAVGGITTIDGDSGSVTGSTVTIYTDQTGNNSGATFKFVNSGTTSTLDVTDGNFNTMIGSGCGVPAMSLYNTGYGIAALGSANISSAANTAIGAYALNNAIGGFNTALGVNANRFLTSGTNNVAVGYEALQNDTTAYDNVVIGYQAMGIGTTTGVYQNTVVGYQAMGASSTSGAYQNTAIGYNNLYNIEGRQNTALGANNLVGETTGLANTAVGFSNMTSTTGCINNVAIGTDNLQNSTGSTNVAIGVICMQAATGASNIVAIGYDCHQSGSSAQYNIAIGTNAMTGATTALHSTGIGYLTLTNDATSLYNTVVGDNSMSGTTGSAYNSVFGAFSGTNYTSSESSNIILGCAIPGVAGESNVVRIGNQGSGIQQQNQCFISGITGATVTGTAVLCSTTGQLGTIVSSERYKENISDMPEQTSILNLRPVQFSYKKDQLHSRQFGLIAEEVHASFPYLCLYNDEGLPESVKYHELPIFLLKEIQKLNQKIHNLESEFVGRQ